MADLDAFFKKKEEKKKKKKKGVMDINSIAEKLQKAVTEELQEEQEEAEKAAVQEEFRQLRKPGEDSDWHDYVEPSGELMEGVKVKAMDYEEKVDAEEEAENESEETEEKTKESSGIAPWAKPVEEKDSDEEDEEIPILPPAPAEPDTDTKKGYVPPGLRRAHLGLGMGGYSAAAPDLASDELFPSLEIADQKEKEIHAELKRMEHNKAVKAGGKKPGGAKGAAEQKEEGGWTSVGDSKYRPGAMRGSRVGGSGMTSSPAPTLRTPRFGITEPPQTGPILPSGPAAALEIEERPSAWGNRVPDAAPTSWRSAGSEPTASAAPTNAWRPTTTPAAPPAPAPAPTKPGSYVPPSRRQVT